MRYVEYGKTGKKVSVVGFGVLRFDLEKSDEENAKLVKYAYEKGINYFDTAPGYCDDRSEAIFGVAFREMIKEGKTDFYSFTIDDFELIDFDCPYEQLKFELAI